MNKYFFLGALETLLLLLPVPLALLVLGSLLPTFVALALSFLLALVLAWRFAMPHIRPS